MQFIYILIDMAIGVTKAQIVNAQAGAVNGICISFSGWALRKRGPVLVSVFSPISTVCTVIFSGVTLGVTINIGRYLDKIPSY